MRLQFEVGADGRALDHPAAVHGITTGVIAADLLHRASRQRWANERTRYRGSALRAKWSNRAETIEHVRKLLNFATPAADASAKAQQASETDEAQPLARPCPRCGGRMFVIEIFLRGQQPKHRPTPLPPKIRIDAS